MTIAEMQEQVMEWCQRKGWNENIVLGNIVANLHTEISEAWEEIRNGKEPDNTYYNGTKPEGFGIELTDCFIRILHICEYYHIDLEGLYHEKMKYNETRDYRHGGKTA